MATNLQRKTVELNGFIKITAANSKESAAPIAAKNHFWIFIRSKSTAHWIFTSPVIKIRTPYKIVNKGKVTINHWDLNKQNNPAAENSSPFARLCCIAALPGSVLK